MEMRRAQRRLHRSRETPWFTHEGTWRNATIYKGRSRDTAWFAITDDDWRNLRPIYRAWLAPSNFVDGRQRSALSELVLSAETTTDACAARRSRERVNTDQSAPYRAIRV